MVLGSKLKCPSKVSWGSLTFSLLQCNLQQLFGKCTGRDEKCGKMWENVENVEKCEKCADNPFSYILLLETYWQMFDLFTLQFQDLRQVIGI